MRRSHVDERRNKAADLYLFPNSVGVIKAEGIVPTVRVVDVVHIVQTVQVVKAARVPPAIRVVKAVRVRPAVRVVPVVHATKAQQTPPKSRHLCSPDARSLNGRPRWQGASPVFTLETSPLLITSGHVCHSDCGEHGAFELVGPRPRVAQ